MNLNILFEDKDIIVCHKPVGIASQNDRSFNPDMTSLLKNHLAKSISKSSANGIKKEPYVGVIHRLDKPVEGVLVYGKNPKAAAFLSRQVSEKNGTKNLMVKKYIAKVYGLLPIDENNETHLLEHYLFQDKKSNKSKVVTKEHAGCKLARLSYRCKEHLDINEQTASIVDITLQTGRHHQIRVQFSQLGYPIVGDRKYGKKDDSGKGLELCAYSLSFVHPNGKKMTFTI